MRGINLGLENLAANSANLTFSDKAIAYYEAMENLTTTLYDFKNLISTYESICGISDCIKKYGVTQSLETLYGENFKSVASMEEETEAAKKTLGTRIKEGLKQLWDAIVRFFKKIGDFFKGLWDKVKKIKFKNPFSFKKKNGETVEVKNEADLKKQDAAMQSESKKKLEEIQKLEKEIKAEYEKAGGGKSGAVERKMTITTENEGRIKELTDKLAALRKEVAETASDYKAFTEAADRAEKMLSHKKDSPTVQAFKDLDYDPNESGLSGGESYR